MKTCTKSAWTALLILGAASCGKVDEEISENAPVTSSEFNEVMMPEPAPDLSGLNVGSLRGEVIDLMGQPTGNMEMGGTEFLYYHSISIEVQNGLVSRIPEDLNRIFREEQLKAFEMEKAQQQEVAVRKKERLQGTKGYIEIRNGGKQEDVQSMVGQGRVTVVDFFADWCGPCHQMKPHLVRLAKEPNVDLIMIDIVDMSSPISKQFKIRSIPNVWVFDAEGKQVGDATYDFRKIAKHVEKATSRL